MREAGRSRYDRDRSDYGKPRPALIVKADAFLALPSVTVLRLTSDIQAGHLVRITVPPTPENGLREPSQVMIDKAVTVPRERVGTVIRRLDDAGDANGRAGHGRVSWVGPGRRGLSRELGRQFCRS